MRGTKAKAERRAGVRGKPARRSPVLPAPHWRGHAEERRSAHAQGRPKNAKQKLVVIDEKLKTARETTDAERTLQKMAERWGDRQTMLQKMKGRFTIAELTQMIDEIDAAGVPIHRTLNGSKYDYSVALINAVVSW